MDLNLKGKSVLVTGGSKGTGAACARLFSQEGARVAITARTADDLEARASQISAETGNEVIPLAGDWRSWDDVVRVVDQTISAFGGIDIFVPNAGDAPVGDFLSLTDDDWDRGLSLKLMGHMRGCRAVLPHMVRQGSGAIIMVVGNDGLKAPYGEVVPGACNAANINVAQALAEQFGYRGIRVNTVNPGPIDTTRWDYAEGGMAKRRGIPREQAHAMVLASLPPGYVCSPEEVAQVVVFLASDKASYVNGAHIPVDGGQRKALMHADEHFDIRF